MKPRAQATLDVMQALLNSAFDGQMRRGDSLDAWAFNDALHKSGAPTQADSQEARATLSVRLLDFVMSQSSEKKASLERVLPALQTLFRENPFITVILLSSGENEFHGSVCDGLINSSFKRLHDRQQLAQKPLVTVVRAIGGQVTDCKVVPAPEPVNMPPLPQPEVRLQDVATTTDVRIDAQPTPQPPPSAIAKPVPSASQADSTTSPSVVQPAPSPKPDALVASAALGDAQQVPLPAGVKADPPEPTANITQSTGPSREQKTWALEKPPAGPTLLGASSPSGPPRSFLRENGKFILVAFAASLAAAFFFYNWLKTLARRCGK